MKEFINQIICGDAKPVLKTLPDESINCCISSPPYWALRDYGVEGQLGLEKTFEEYIDKLCGVYDEVKRVLRADGTCFVNLGDTYAGGGRGYEYWNENDKQSTNPGSAVKCPKVAIPDKSLCLIPFRFAIEMVDRGWILRNTIIWSKPNPMPSSAKDRFTVDFEYVFFFSKSRKYWFEQQFEPFLTESNAERPRMGQGQNTRYKQKRNESKNLIARPKPHNMHISRTEGIDQNHFNPLGRNKRSIWTIPTEPCPEAHFATFPKKLVEPMIKAGCPEFVCKKCGKAREKMIEYSGGTIGKSWHEHKADGTVGMSQDHCFGLGEKLSPTGEAYNRSFKGYTDCGCNAGFEGGIVLDPFCGTGTVCVVAAQLKRNYIGIDINPEYVQKFALPKTQAVETGVPVAEQKAGQIGLFDC